MALPRLQSVTQAEVGVGMCKFISNVLPPMPPDPSTPSLPKPHVYAYPLCAPSICPLSPPILPYVYAYPLCILIDCGWGWVDGGWVGWGSL